MEDTSPGEAAIKGGVPAALGVGLGWGAGDIGTEVSWARDKAREAAEEAKRYSPKYTREGNLLKIRSAKAAPKEELSAIPRLLMFLEKNPEITHAMKRTGLMAGAVGAGAAGTSALLAHLMRRKKHEGDE